MKSPAASPAAPKHPSEGGSTRKLPLGVPAWAPLVSVYMAKAILPDSDEDEILQLIDEGFLPWAWNIASAEGYRREVRILKECVEFYAVTLGHRTFPELSQGDVIAKVLPPACKERPWVLGTQLENALMCSQELIGKLVEHGDLNLVPGTKITRGPKGSACITRQSVERFLEGRLL